MHHQTWKSWLHRPQQVLGAITAASMLVAPIARAEDTAPASAETDKRLRAVEGRVKELESQMRGPGTKESGLIPHTLLGPRLNLIALPSPTLGVEAKIFRYLGVSFDYGFIPKITIDDVTVQYDMWNVTARVYPWGKTFFVGGMLGHYGIKATAANGVGSGSTEVSSDFVGPVIGGRWIQDSGFFTGLDLGRGFPIKYSSTASTDASGKPIDIKNKADQYLQHGIPLIAVVSFGYFF